MKRPLQQSMEPDQPRMLTMACSVQYLGLGEGAAAVERGGDGARFRDKPRYFVGAGNAKSERGRLARLDDSSLGLRSDVWG